MRLFGQKLTRPGGQRYIALGLGLLMGVIAQPTRVSAQACIPIDSMGRARIEAMLAAMSVDEKVAQMRIFHANADARLFAGTTAITLGANGEIVMPQQVRDRFAFGIAGVKNPGETLSPEQSARLTNALQTNIMAASPNRIPALFVGEAYNGLDVEGSTKFARPIAMASTFNPKLIHDAWDIIGREARLRGFHMIHSPVGDMHRDPRFGRMSEGYGEDTMLSRIMVTAAVRGVQGDQVGLRTTHVGAVTKHFVGYGQVDGGRNFASVNINPRDLIDQYLKPFQGAVEDGCTLGIMPSHGDINGVASHGNRALLTDTLRGAWGFDGYVVSDAEDVSRLGFFMGVAANDQGAALLGLSAGVDIDLYSERAYVHLPSLAASDPAVMPMIDQAARRVLGVKYRLGLLDNPMVHPAAAQTLTRTPASLALARQIDLEAAILLKNKDGLLPLSVQRPQRIALLGPLVSDDDRGAFARVLHAQSRVTVERGLELTNGDETSPRLVSAQQNKVGFLRAVAAARRSDVAIVFIGDDAFTAREAYFRSGIEGDRASLDPVGQQIELVRAIKATGKPVIVVVRARRSLALGDILASSDALFQIWEPGENGSEALAQLMTGGANPSGRLPVSLPRHVGQLPIHYSQKRINAKKGYLFEDDGPLFPFGFGLSYTQFSYGPITLSSNIMQPAAPIRASIDVRNTGSRAGYEVVQLYLSDPVASVTRPTKELKAFEKIWLEPGQARLVTFDVTPDMLVHTGADMAPDPGFGAFTIEIAPSSAGGGHTKDAEYKPR